MSRRFSKRYVRTDLGFRKIQGAVGQPHHIKRITGEIECEVSPKGDELVLVEGVRGTYEGSPGT